MKKKVYEYGDISPNSDGDHTPPPCSFCETEATNLLDITPYCEDVECRDRAIAEWGKTR